MKKTLLFILLLVFTFCGIAQSVNQDYIFLENKGQLDSRIKFTTQQNGVKMYLAANSIEQLNISGLQKGTYFLKYRFNNSTFKTQKVLLQ